MPTINRTMTLSSGYEMPVIGLGTWQSPPEEVENAVTVALECGYRHIDTAYGYYNEDAIGRSLRKWIDEGGAREDIFVTTKLFTLGNRASDVDLYLTASLEKLGLDYVDMYLIHTPFGLARGTDMDKWQVDDDDNVILEYNTDHVAIWKEMEKQVEAGRIKSIGISNFSKPQIMNIIDNCDTKPCNLQTEAHAYNQIREMREFCNEHNIVITAYGSLGSQGTVDCFKRNGYLEMPKILEHTTVLSIAEAHKKTPAQILLRHQIQGDLIVIPKSINPDRIRENFDVFDFELNDDEMKQLNELDMGEEGRMLMFNRYWKGVERHPQYND